MLKFGWSKKDISIEGPIAITGQFYQRISKGILDPNRGAGKDGYVHQQRGC